MRVLLSAALCTLSALLVLLLVPPVYEVHYGDRLVGIGRDLPQLRRSLLEHAREVLHREVTLEAEGHTWSYRAAELGLLLPADQVDAALAEAVGQVPRYRRLAWNRVRLSVAHEPSWDSARLEEALAPVRQALGREPVPAELKVVQQRPLITPEQPGLTVQTQAVLRVLQGLGDVERLQVPLTPVLPAVTRSSLEALGIRRMIAEWSTHYDPTIARAENVERAARAFHGLMLKPGEILSYNATVGPVSAATGWKEAFVIVNGEMVKGVGGGVCQVATTFYGAALRANMDILERHPHQLVVPYVEPSQDAAIAQGWEDLKIRNTTPGHVLVETEAGGGTVTFRLYGTLPEGQEVRIESRVLERRPYPIRWIADPGVRYGDEVVRLPGHDGLISEGFRLVYQHGEIVRRERLSRDSYRPATQVVLIGPALP